MELEGDARRICAVDDEAILVGEGDRGKRGMIENIRPQTQRPTASIPGRKAVRRREVGGADGEDGPSKSIRVGATGERRLYPLQTACDLCVRGKGLERESKGAGQETLGIRSREESPLGIGTA